MSSSDTQVTRNGPAPAWAGIHPPFPFSEWVGRVTAGVGLMCREAYLLGLVGVCRRVRECEQRRSEAQGWVQLQALHCGLVQCEHEQSAHRFW